MTRHELPAAANLAILFRGAATGLLVLGLSAIAASTARAVDTVPPGQITTLVVQSHTATSATLTWIATGDDGDSGTASTYDIRYSVSPLTDANWVSASQATGEPAPLPAGTAQSCTVHGLAPSTSYYFGMKVADEEPNWSELSNIAAVAYYTIGGTIRTPLGTNALANDVPVRYIRVIIMDEEGAIDQELGRTFTSADGTFSLDVVDDELADVFINVEYVGDAIDGRFVEVRASNADPDPILDEDIEATVHTDLPPSTSVDLGVLHCLSTRANVVSHGCEAFRYLDAQYPAYTLPENPRYQARATGGGSSCAGTWINISLDDYGRPGEILNAAYSDIHHETFHWIAYHAYGNRWPDNNCNPPSHNELTQSCQGFAIMEGSAQYFGNISAIAMFGGDAKTGIPAPNTWRGGDNTGNDNSGEIVEGTYTRALRERGDHPGQLQVLVTNSPDSWTEFRDAYAALRGATSSDLRLLLDEMARNGIVYTRGKLEEFLPDDDPPDDAPPAAGNYKTIRDIAFVRGEVKPQVLQLTAAELRLESGVTEAADQKDLGYKLAAPTLNDGIPTAFTFLGAVPFASDIDWDTKAIPDEEYDLVVRTRNAHLWLDIFYPDFSGDQTVAVNTNEKWLKTLRTWFNRDNSPSSDDEGKVVVDNTAPDVIHFKPEAERP